MSPRIMLSSPPIDESLIIRYPPVVTMGLGKDMVLELKSIPDTFLESTKQTVSSVIMSSIAF